MVQINLRSSKAFLEDIDTTWTAEGFNSRSEFLRYAARDAVKHPEFSREGWKQIAASEHELRSGDAELVSREEVVEMMGRDEYDEWLRTRRGWRWSDAITPSRWTTGPFGNRTAAKPFPGKNARRQGVVGRSESIRKLTVLD
jgi:Arc/MetJ-type ribon-helix-helix transcriptional regulator